MASRKTQEVLIDGKVYRLSGYESESYLQSVASYLNRRIEELKKLDSYRKLNPEQRALLLELNLADDYFKARETIDRLKEDEQKREKEIYELKHELAAARIEISKSASEKKQNADKDASEESTPKASSVTSSGKAQQENRTQSSSKNHSHAAGHKNS